MTVDDVQRAVQSGIGGEDIAQNVEGRERYPINVRYQRDFRDTPEELARVLVESPSGAQIPLGYVAHISFSRGPAMIRDEDGPLTGYVYIDLNTDYGGFVNHASQLLKQELTLPAGYTYQWSGEYEFQVRARERLQLIVPIVFAVILLLLYLVFHSVTEALVLIFPTVYAISGGACCLQWMLGYNFSVAVWVGYIALFGIAVETGVVMVVYLHEALERRLLGQPLTLESIQDAAIEGAVHRLRPKLMTVTCRAGQPGPDSVGNRHRLRCNEADRGAHRRRDDHVDDPCFDSRAGFLRVDTKTCASARDSESRIAD